MPPFICWFQYAVKLKLLHIGVVHVVLGVSDHALYHFAANGAGLTGSKIAVVALLQINVKRVGNFSLEVLQLLAVFLIACHCVFHLLFLIEVSGYLPAVSGLVNFITFIIYSYC